MIAELENLNNRLASEETEASLAIYDMCATGAIYQNQSDLEFYTVNKNTGTVMKVDRWRTGFEKQVGCYFKKMYSVKWKKVLND